MNLATLQPSSPPEKLDLDEIARAVALLVVPGDVVELRALNTPRGTVSGYFADHQALTQAAAHWSGIAKSVYITLNPVAPDLLARACNRAVEYARFATLDEQIIQRRLFLVDCDPIRPVGISANEEEKASALKRAVSIRDVLRDLSWPEPILADSGNGAHLLYRVNLPNDDQSRDSLKACLGSLADDFNDGLVSVDTSTFNASRISKLYGTLSAKGDHLPELGRIHRIARILEVPSSWK